MANRTIFTDIFRLSYPWLSEPQPPQNAGESAKYGIAMLFPQSGILPVNNQRTSPDSIFAALNECCMEMWNITFEQATAEGMGIQFPPKKKDGNLVFQKDANKNPIPNQVEPNSANMWIVTCKNEDPIGCVDPTGRINISPKELLAGYWACAEIDCAAYENKSGQRVVSIKLINIQLCYKDETFGEKRIVQDANVSFANRGIADSNIAAGSIQPMISSNTATSNVPNIAPPPPAPAPSVPPPPTPAPSIAPPPPPPPAPTLDVNTDPVIMNEGEASYKSYKEANWTDQQIIDAGKGKRNYLNPAT